MDYKILKDDENELMVEFNSPDLTIPDLVANTALEDSKVTFAGVYKEHPDVGNPQLVIKTKGEKAAEAFKRALNKIESSIKDMKKQLK